MDVVVAMTLLVYRSAVRNALLEHGGEVAHFDVEVDLGREKRHVTERLLHGADGSAAAEKMSGVAVADAMRRRSLPKASAPSGLDDESGEVFSGELPFPVTKRAPYAEAVWRRAVPGAPPELRDDEDRKSVG